MDIRPIDIEAYVSDVGRRARAASRAMARAASAAKDQALAATAALRDSERTFRIVAQVSNDEVWEWDLVHNQVWHNNSARCAGSPDAIPAISTSQPMMGLMPAARVAL